MQAQPLVPDWYSARARALIKGGDIAGLIRWARQQRGWRQADLGKAAGYSASAVSRLETGVRPATDIDMLNRLTDALAIPQSLFAAALGMAPDAPPRTTVTPTHQGGRGGFEEDPMKRRSVLGAGAAAVPLSVLTALDDALDVSPAPRAAPTPDRVVTEYRQARALFDGGDHPRLMRALPDLLATAEARADTGEGADYARLAACYDLATEALSKIGQRRSARITADRSTIYARISGSPLAAASSARALSIVLRHEGRATIAQHVTLQAAAALDAAGPSTPAQAAALAQMLCTASYAAAEAGDRERALEMIHDAERAAAQLPSMRSCHISTATVTLYKVGVLWSLGDAGAAVAAGRTLNPAQFSTAERRGRYHTDMARAWWRWGKPEETAQALLGAHHIAPAEIRDRASIRAIVTELSQRHPRAGGVRELLTLTRLR
ncbi:helix-turn-helix domain-containing protein [Streptomyces xiamenensis]|uniref:Helix-turn-helix domain-containing protein n=2 Tax=Streptomyces xiamenensis TaxID=408015 RepID=A0A0F7CPY3_9ACTN|nr:helix-turn-helix domain-containing protein [Streptomyces xiamenensis]